MLRDNDTTEVIFVVILINSRTNVLTKVTYGLPYGA